MTIAAAVLSVLLAVVATMSAVAKLRKEPRVVEGITSVGVKVEQLPALAGLELAGAVGVLIGFTVPALGVLAATGLCLYFVGAVVAHLRAGQDPDTVVVPLLLAVLAAAAAVTRALA